MRPQDIERIANTVVGAFSAATPASAGCLGASDENPFDCNDDFSCATGFECGGAAAFTCSLLFSGDPECEDLFSCGYVNSRVAVAFDCSNPFEIP